MVNPEMEDTFAVKVLESISKSAANPAKLVFDEEQARNAANGIITFVCNRLGAQGEQTAIVSHTTYEWGGGVLNLRNFIGVRQFWTNLMDKHHEKLMEVAPSKPLVYVAIQYRPNDSFIHLWAIPGYVMQMALDHVPFENKRNRWTIRISPQKNIFEMYEGNSPDLSIYYRKVEWTADELSQILQATKIDSVSRQRNKSEDDGENMPDEELSEMTPGYSEESVAYLAEIANRTQDSVWHNTNKERFKSVLKKPTSKLLAAIRERYIEKLDSTVAGVTHALAQLKKNDYGRKGYYSHYWFALYDPAATSKKNSTQLYFLFGSSDMSYRYGLGHGDSEPCQLYLERLHNAVSGNREAVCGYLAQAPKGTLIRTLDGEKQIYHTAAHYVSMLNLRGNETDTKIDGIIQQKSISELPKHDETIIDDVGTFFTWVWPFFQASRTGKFITGHTPSTTTLITSEAIEVEANDAGEDAAQSLQELHEMTSLPIQFLDSLQRALQAKQQAVLVGPPGTSKTFIAGQFARYFANQGRTPGDVKTLYMHSNWTYEDFFEGLRPTASATGQLTFKKKKGVFLKWIESIAKNNTARHVLILDEINRCDTAAVLGELLQLMEYRGTTVPLLSGRPFVLPKNVYILGTMNSADRSVGRMDLALRRRFYWLELHPSIETLKTWLEKPEQNLCGFSAESLAKCNGLLKELGIGPEQHIGHALFMNPVSESTDDPDSLQEAPLTEKELRRVVEFSVIPYVKELLISQHGQSNTDVITDIEKELLKCVNR